MGFMEISTLIQQKIKLLVPIEWKERLDGINLLLHPIISMIPDRVLPKTNQPKRAPT